MPTQVRPGPRIVVGLQTVRSGEGLLDERVDGGETDVGCDPELPGEFLGDPTLDAPGGHGHDLGGERIVRDIGCW
jgi:hypothetical protein